MSSDCREIDVENPFGGAPVLYADSLDTTMLSARRLVSAGYPGGTVIAAGHQSAGRGRIAERRWEAEAAKSLMFTLILDNRELSGLMGAKPLVLLPVHCGLAVSRAAAGLLIRQESDPEQIRIKWPNDVLFGGRKLCGILCESSGGFSYAGIGINVNQTEFPDGLRRPPASIASITGRRLDEGCAEAFPGPQVRELLSSVLGELYSALSSDGWREEVEERLYLMGEPVRMECGLASDSAREGRAGSPEIVEGTVLGLGRSGALRVRTGSGIREIVCGEYLS